MTNQKLMEAKALIVHYYTVVDIKKTRGFSAEPNRSGEIPGSDKSYKLPIAAIELQKNILTKNNELIEEGLLNEFNLWLKKYERSLIYAK